MMFRPIPEIVCQIFFSWVLLSFAVIKETPLKSKNIKHKNLNILHRSAGSLKTERFARDSKEIY
jgi:hypothetical protein